MALKNRLGVSALSKSKWKDAWDEELLMNKETGEILMKPIDGDVLSYEYMTRLNNHIDAFSDKINDLGLQGIMSIVINDNDEKTLPMRIPPRINILDESILLGSGLKYVMVSLSSDTIIPNGVAPRLEQVPFTYVIELRDVNNVPIRSFTYTTGYDESLSKIRDIEDLGVKYDKAYLTNVYLNPDPESYYEVSPIHIAHSILVFIGGGDS